MIINIIKWLIVILIPLIYQFNLLEANIIIDILWIIALSQITKELIMKYFFKNKYCEIKK
jgi:hypothetical protein